MTKGDRWRRRVAAAPALVLGLAVAAVLGSCSGDDGTAGTTTAPVERTARRGDVTLTVRLDADRVLVGQPLRLEVDVAAPEGVDVTMPDPGEALGPFTVTDERRPPGIPEPDGGRRVWRHAYLLETYESGELELPSLSLVFADRRDAATAAPDAPDVPDEPAETLTVEPVPVRVESVVAGDGEAELRGMRGFVDLPSQRSWWPWAVAAGVVLALAATVFVVRRFRRRSGSGPGVVPAVVVPAEVWARAELDRLEAEQLPRRGETHAFFFRLSGIVREYIERRFSLRAPERTTEEFIREMRDHPVLAPEHQDLLRGFLRAADMVKFALHRPPAGACAEALGTARSFVSETTPTSPGARGTGGGAAEEAAA